MSEGSRTARRTALAASVAAVLLISACADFSGSESAPFTGPPTGGAPTTTPPQLPTSAAPKPPGPCIDQDPLVLATCLTDPTSLITTPDLEHAYVAERGGTVQYTTTDQASREVLRIGVDTAGDGGLTSIALSPTYDQDRLYYAYVSTPTDNRVVRVTPGDEPKVILAGIPKGPLGNAGSLLFVGRDLIVATGNAGDQAAARDPRSLAGKVLLLPSPGTVTPTVPEVLATDGGIRASLCQAGPKGPVFVADQGATEDRLRVVTPGSPTGVAWTWPDRPGIAGCAVVDGGVVVSHSRAGRVEFVVLPKGSTTADKEPLPMLDRKRYGVFGRLATGPKGLPQGVTTNKATGPVAPTDDRVVLLPLPGGDAASSED